MFKKLLALVVTIMLIGTTALASPDGIRLNAVYAADENFIFSYASSVVEAISEKATEDDVVVIDATHAKEIEAWDGQTVTSAEELETKAQTIDGVKWYVIENGADLAGFSVNIVTCDADEDGAYENAAANAILAADINLAKANGSLNSFNAYMIGGEGDAETVKTSYKGIFDGKGHTIYNYFSGNPYKTYATGLFKQISGATIKNLNMVGAKAILSTTGESASYSNGFLCAYASSSTISNIYVSGEATVHVPENEARVKYSRVHRFGSIAGTATASADKATKITNCYSDANYDFSMQESTVAIINQPSYDAITPSTSVGIGGIVGYTTDGNTIRVTNCGFGGTIYAPKHRAVGGIIGHTGSASHLAINCYNQGDITAYGSVAGIIGCGRTGSQSTFHSSNGYNTGTITAIATENPLAAGIAAQVRRRNLDHTPCKGYVLYNAADVRMQDESADDTTNALIMTIKSTNKNDTINAGASYYNSAYADVPRNYYPVEVTITNDDETTTTEIQQKEYFNGTGFTEEEFKSEEAVTAMNANANGNFLMDIHPERGLNEGYPIMAPQLEDIATNEEVIEIGAYTKADGVSVVKTAGATLAEAGYVALDVVPVTESVTIAVFDGETKVSETTVTDAGIISLAAPENATIQAIEGRALIEFAEDVPLTDLAATTIKAGFPSEESATVAIALYGADGKIKKIAYNADAEVINVGTEEIPSNQVSAFIDLDGIDVSGCTLKAFIWENGSPNPLQSAATLN